MKKRIHTTPTLEKVINYTKSNRAHVKVGKAFFEHFAARQWMKKGKSILPYLKEELARWIAKWKKDVIDRGCF
jgi:hypothetical protein